MPERRESLVESLASLMDPDRLLDGLPGVGVRPAAGDGPNPASFQPALEIRIAVEGAVRGRGVCAGPGKRAQLALLLVFVRAITCCTDSMIRTAQFWAASLGRRGRSVHLTVYAALATSVTLVAANGATLWTSAGIIALIVAPLAVVSAALGGYVIGIPWLLGLTDADPDTYGIAWIVPFVAVGALVNAAIYLGLARRWAHGRGRP